MRMRINVLYDVTKNGIRRGYYSRAATISLTEAIFAAFIRGGDYSRTVSDRGSIYSTVCCTFSGAWVMNGNNCRLDSLQIII